MNTPVFERAVEIIIHLLPEEIDFSSCRSLQERANMYGDVYQALEARVLESPLGAHEEAPLVLDSIMKVVGAARELVSIVQTRGLLREAIYVRIHAALDDPSWESLKVQISD